MRDDEIEMSYEVSQIKLPWWRRLVTWFTTPREETDEEWLDRQW